MLTNAAGGIRRTFASGTVMLIADHINLTFRNPLIGPVLPGEERFPDMSEPYDAALRALAREVAQERQIAAGGGGLRRSCWGRATRRRPRSGCWSGWVPMRWGCPPCWRSSPPGPGGSAASASRWSPIPPPASHRTKLDHVEVMETARRSRGTSWRAGRRGHRRL